MSLSAPHRTTGEMITASIWNTDLVDPLNSLPVSIDGLTWQGRVNANPQATAPFNTSYSAFAFQPVVYKNAGGGTHPSIIGVQIDAPILGAGAATVTNAATLVVNGAPVGAGSNTALLVTGAGLSSFQGPVLFYTDVTTGLSFDDSRVTGILSTTVTAYIGPAAANFRIQATTDVPVLFGTNGTDLIRLRKDNLAIDFATADGEYLSFQSTGDVAHGFTTDTATQSFGSFRKAAANFGGLSISGFTETTFALLFNAQYTTGDTSKTVTANAAAVITGNKLFAATAGQMATGENLLALKNNTSTRFIFDGDGGLSFVGTTAPATGYVGPAGANFRVQATADIPVLFGTNSTDIIRLLKDNLAVDFGTASGEYLTLQSTATIAHGFTSDTATASFGTLRKAVAANGGLSIDGFTETTSALVLTGNYTTGDTSKTTSSGAAITITANKLSGSTAGAMAANENILTLRSNTSTRFIFDAEGDLHVDSSTVVFDEWDDIALTRAIDLTRGGKGLVKTAWDAYVQYHKTDLVRAGIMSEDGMINMTRHAQLLNGATWQLFQKLQTLTERVAQLEATA